MKINILSHQEKCIKFLSLFPLNGNASLQVESEELLEAGNLPDFTTNDFGWTSWINMYQFRSLRSPNYIKKNRVTYSEQIIKSNVFRASDFLKENEIFSFEKLQAVFFSKIGDSYETETVENRIKRLRKLKVNKNCYSVSLNFIYQQEGENLFPLDKYVEESYFQLKMFYTLFIQNFNSELLYVTPHFDPDVSEEREILEGIYYPDDYSPSDPEDNDFSWDDEVNQEKRQMNDETDGFWNWNID